MTTLPGFYRHTDPSGDTLDISPALSDIDGHEVPVAALALDIPDGLGITIHIPPGEVENVVTAIRTAAGQDQPTVRDEEMDRLRAELNKANGRFEATAREAAESAQTVERLRTELEQARGAAPLTVAELAHALDNSTPYPVELPPQVLTFMATQLLNMIHGTKRPEHNVWQPEEPQPQAGHPGPETPA